MFESRVKRTLLSSAVLVALSVGGASAAQVVFDLTVPADQSTNWSELPSSFSLSDSATGLTATFKAGSFKNGIDITECSTTVSPVTGGYTIGGTDCNGAPRDMMQVNDARIGRYTEGAGVMNSATDNNHLVDGYRRNDFIEVAFSDAVSIDSVSFGFYSARDEGDRFRWLWDLSGDGSIGFGDFLSDKQPVNPFMNFGGVVSDVFAFGTFRASSAWALKSITVNYQPAGSRVDTSPVPLPAAGFLMIGALGGLAVLRRRKREN